MEHFDIIVIGSGPGGEGAAMMAAKNNRRVAVVERHTEVDGGCTHWGTIPSKALRHAVKTLHDAHTLEVRTRVRDSDSDSDSVLQLESGRRIKSDVLLSANGRTGNTDKMNLEALGLEPDGRGQLQVNEHYQTALPHICAAGADDRPAGRHAQDPRRALLRRRRPRRSCASARP